MSIRIALSAFACDPSKGSEPANGWNFGMGLAQKGFEVHCFTRQIGKEAIEKTEKPTNLHFHYVVLPLKLEALYSRGRAFIYLYYLLWQWKAATLAKKHHRKTPFNLVHHITWGSLQLGSFMYKLGIPFFFGPAGGGQHSLPAYKDYFKQYWDVELKREKISRLLLKYNPAFRQMARQATTILVSNPDTSRLAQAGGAKKIMDMLDASIPESFLPPTLPQRDSNPGQIRLLWVGRMMARKGILLVLDTMKELKNETGISLTVVGDGDEMRNYFLEAISAYQLQSSVNWVGTVPFEQVRSYYASHDVFFFTSLRDSGAVQLLEAMAFGLPVVTLNLHGQAAIVNDATGIKVSVENPARSIEELKAAILLLRDQPDLRLRKSKAAFDFARTQTWPNKIDRMIETCYQLPGSL